MTKTFNYPISGVSVYLESTDETEDYIDRSVEYTANNDELLEAVANIVCEEFFVARSLQNHKTTIQCQLKDFIYWCDLLKPLCEIYEDKLYDYFKDYALGKK